jgi:hypothetical protein
MSPHTVTLKGGPLNGETRRVNRTRNHITLDFESEDVERDWDGTTVYVTRIGQASYRRVDETTFEHCPTQTAMGETDVPWFEDLPDLEKEEP